MGQEQGFSGSRWLQRKQWALWGCLGHSSKELNFTRFRFGSMTNYIFIAIKLN